MTSKFQALTHVLRALLLTVAAVWITPESALAAITVTSGAHSVPIFHHEWLAALSLGVLGMAATGNRMLDLLQRKNAAVTEGQAILTLAQSENRALTAEERSSLDAKITESQGITETIELEQRFAGMSPARGTGADVKDLSADKPWWGEREVSASETKMERRSRLEYGYGQQLLAIVNAARSPHSTDTRLVELNQRAAAGMSEAVPADGGFLIAPEFSSEVLSIAHDTGLVFNSGRRIPLSQNTNAIKIPAVDEQSRADGSRWGGVRAYWMNEAEALTATKPKFRLLELVTKKLGVLSYVTDELLADSTALGSILTQGTGEEFGFKLDDAAINGDGAGKPQGILNAPCTVSVAKEAGQTATTVVLANIVKMWSRLYSRSRQRAVWFCNQDVEQQLWNLFATSGTGAASVVAGFGGGATIFIPAGFNGNQYALLLGRPVIPIEQCQTLGTVGDILLADMSQWVYIDKGGPLNAVSMHVKFLTDEMTFRSIMRVDGQPWWNTALTPFKGSATISPFISLATRS